MNWIRELLKISKKNENSRRRMTTGYEKQVTEVETKTGNRQRTTQSPSPVMRDVHGKTTSHLKVVVRV